MRNKNSTAIKRKDIFYLKAKISGYRARSAYKLLQLNQKYDFLGSAKTIIDLCAAPGSWMQVASKTMKPPCVVIGVDINPISPIPNGITIKGDITTDQVKQQLKTNLKTYKADVVLHDGSPNVGTNWYHDAYAQNVLVVYAFKLACEFLKSGGTFVTKVFRSKDHTSLEFVFKKLFKNVESTKPKSSRFESAEIFMVCQGFYRPDKIDPKFFDPKHVFSNLDTQPRNAIDLKHPEKTKRKAVGYEDGISILFKKFKLSAFIDSPEYIEMIEIANQFVWDLPEPMDKATVELKELCKDIKLIGRREIRSLLNFRKTKREEWEKLRLAKAASEEEIKEKQKQLEIKSVEACAPLKQAQEAKDKLVKLEGELTAEQATVKEFEELQHAQKELDEIKAVLLRESKRKVRKLAKQRAKMMERLQLKLMVPGDLGPRDEERGLFTINNFEGVNDIQNIVHDNKMEMIYLEEKTKAPPKYEIFQKNDIVLDSSGLYHRRREEEDSGQTRKRFKMDDELDVDDINCDEDDNVMLRSLGVRDIETFKSAPQKNNRFIDKILVDEYTEADEILAEKWFSKDSYAHLEDNITMDYELDAAIRNAKENTERAEESKKQNKKRKLEEEETEEENSGIKSDSEDSVDCDAFLHEVPEEEKLTDLGLALAAKMMSSKKAKRNVIEDSWNRRTYGDLDDKPDWFENDEKEHNDLRVEVDPEDLRIHRNRTKGVDTRTLKKVVEAKARKARRFKKKMDKANEKIKVITDQAELSEKEKSLEIKKIYTKLRPKKKQVRYIPMKKGAKGAKSRGAGKGPYKLVDRRLKKDKKSKIALAKKRKAKGK